MFADEPYTLYNRIALPPLLRKQIAQPKVIIRDLAWHEKHAIDLHLSTRVDRIDATERVAYANGVGYPYDALLVATGGRPNPSDAPGAAGAHNIYNFQYMDDTLAISERLESAKIAVAVGGSFIAYELARSVRVARRRDALARARTAVPAPLARRDRGRDGRRCGARGRRARALRR